MLRTSSLLAILSLIPMPVHAAIQRVPSDSPTIQAAIDTCVEGDTVLVAPGTYTGEGNKNLDFGGVNLTLISEAGPELTVIDCEGAGRGLHLHHGESAASHIGGFSITRGQIFSTYGGAILCEETSPVLEDLILRGNRAGSGSGGGMAILGGAPVLRRVIFQGNAAYDVGDTAVVWGGGLFCHEASPLLEDVQFIENYARIYYMGWEQCCTAGYGAGMASIGGAPTMLRVIFAANRADGTYQDSDRSEGGGLYTTAVATLSQVTFWGNDCRTGSAWSCLGDAGAEGILCTLNMRGAAVKGAPVLACSDIWGNAAGDWVGDIADQAGANGNLAADPLLCAPEAGDFHVSGDSPCLPANNDCGILVGAWGEGCPGPAAANFLASLDRSDGIFLSWSWDGPAILGFAVTRDDTLVLSGEDPDQRSWLDADCSVGEHHYTLRARHAGGDGPVVFADGKRLEDSIHILSPESAQVLPIGGIVALEWLPRASDETPSVSIELSRESRQGPWETLAAFTANDGGEDWFVTGPWSRSCYLRIADAVDGFPADTSLAAFKVGTRTFHVPSEWASIQAALGQAGWEDTVLVAPGIYHEVGLHLGSGVTLRGDGGASEVVIEALGEGSILSCTDTDERTRIETLSFTGGRAPQGAAIRAQRAYLSILACRFLDNIAGQLGGAIYVVERSHLQIASCHFEANEAVKGGAAYLGNNWGMHDIRECIFTSNRAGVGGGALAFDDSRFFALSDCVFHGNSSGSTGGAVHIEEVYSFMGQRAEIRRCLFAGNETDGLGGAVYCDFSDPLIADCTLYGNRADSAGGGLCVHSAWPHLQNTIVAGSVLGEALACHGGSVPPTLSCCDLFANEGGDWTGCIADQSGIAGNFSADPLFCSVVTADFSLAEGSPCLPANNDCGVLIGAFGEGCPSTPVFLLSFFAEWDGASVNIAWKVTESQTDAELRLSADLGGNKWLVTFAETTPGCFEARDENPELIAGGHVTYELHARETGEDWQLIRSEGIDLTPVAFATNLGQPHPNPFNPRVTIPFSLAARGHVRLSVFDIAGRCAKRLLDESRDAGDHEITWDARDAQGRDLASGVYFLRMAAPGYSKVKRLVLIR